MLFEECEKNLVDAFASLLSEEILLLPQSQNVEKVCRSLLDPVERCKWIDSSGKNDPPPDFYNDTKMLMMDVMRVDDHSVQGRKTIQNANRARQHELEKEIRQKLGMGFEPFELIVSAATDLPTEEDHNYVFYRDDFKRTIEKHITKITRYKNNHPDHAVIFLVYDNYIVDFYCAAAKLVIELDGSQHFQEQGIAYDAERSEVLASHGLLVLRFSNADINERFDLVCERIDEITKERLS